MSLMSLQVREFKYWLRSSLCISLRGMSHKPPLLSVWHNYLTCRFKQASLSALWLCITFPTPPKKVLVCPCTLYSIYILCQYNNIVPFCQQNVYENGTWEALNDKDIYLKSDRGTQLVNPDLYTPRNNYSWELTWRLKTVPHFTGTKICLLTASSSR